MARSRASFPFYVGLFICVASGATLLQAILSKDAKRRRHFVEHGQLSLVLTVLIPAASIVLGIQLIGIYVASAIYIALLHGLLGDYPWMKSVRLASAISVLFFLMFEVWFKVPLFKGYWNLTALDRLLTGCRCTRAPIAAAPAARAGLINSGALGG